jgi:lipid-A-disaccharide synthase
MFRSALLLVNGPGELWGWARPLLVELQRRKVHVAVRLLPCQFASGRERAALENFPGLHVTGPGGVLATLLAREEHTAVSAGMPPPEVLYQMGGDLWMGRALAKRFHVPLVTYAYAPKKSMRDCALACTAFAEMLPAFHRAGISPRLVGDLVKDALRLDLDVAQGTVSPWRRGSAFRIVLFPGSRPAIRNAARTFLRRTVEHLERRAGPLDVVTLLSPFAEGEEFAAWENEGLSPVAAGAGTVLPEAHLALTQPGTNTMELLHTGTPALVAVPEEFFSVVPLAGVAGLLGRTPFVGKILRKHALSRLAKALPFLAWPNRLAGREILPELIGAVTPERLGEAAASLLEDRARLGTIREELCALEGRCDVPGERGAAVRLVDLTEELLSRGTLRERTTNLPQRQE